MFSQYFGNYLLNKGLLSPEQLETALELQKSTHLKLGVLSVNAGYMSAAQVEEVHQKQMQVDKRFGEIAIDLGYMTDAQLEDLLSSQKHSHLLLGQVLLDENIMTLEQFSQTLNEYKEENGLSDEQFSSIKRGDINTLVDTMINVDDSSNSDLYKDYLSLFAKNMIRFVDDQIRIESLSTPELLETEWLVHQNISGENNLYTAILADEKVFIDVAKKYSQEDITEPDELAQASVSEFLNLHNGIFLVNMSNRDVELEMAPQQVEQKKTLSNLERVLLVSVHVPAGIFHVALAKEPPTVK
ncbi:hypothetical protein [Bacillus sp. FJAT-45350]|uniref:hypothetical protein n=1 Tax=Bacillus sp. FJAT-45350 TaxID=2011014 RepID=UPI000BB8F947|nr:hypothetical protein [Bacillus sp. FJAT-45350]